MALKPEYVLQRFRQVHGDKYDYSKMDYKTGRTNIIIICPEHGEFEARPSNHYYNKTGCPKCGDRLKGPRGSKHDK